MGLWELHIDVERKSGIVVCSVNIFRTTQGFDTRGKGRKNLKGRDKKKVIWDNYILYSN